MNFMSLCFGRVSKDKNTRQPSPKSSPVDFEDRIPVLDEPAGERSEDFETELKNEELKNETELKNAARTRKP